jgi:hypothetical protein
MMSSISGKGIFPFNVESLARGDHALRPDAHAELSLSGSTPSRSRKGIRYVRWGVNLWLVLHLVAIIVAPASMDPSSDLIRSLHDVCRPYLGVLFLDHGYHFFSPEPEESTLLAFEAERRDGSVHWGRIPDRKQEPRLLYHRYFMLTEHMSRSPDEFREQWHQSYAQHIGRRFGAARVRLTQQTHLLSSMERIREGGRLSDPESYEEQPLGDFSCDGY